MTKNKSSVTVETLIPQWLAFLKARGQSARMLENNNYLMRSGAKRVNILEISPRDVTPERVRAFVNFKEAAGSSRNVYRSIIRSFFHWALARGIVDVDPTIDCPIKLNDLPQERRQPQATPFITDGEILKLIAGFDELIKKQQEKLVKATGDERDKRMRRISDFQFWIAAVVISRYTGMTLSDITSLEWKQIKPDVIMVWDKMHQEQYPVPRQPELLNLIVKQIEPRHKVYCFPEQRADMLNLATRTKFSIGFNRFCQQFGIGDRGFRSLRATYIAQADRNRVPIPHIRGRFTAAP